MRHALHHAPQVTCSAGCTITFTLFFFCTFGDCQLLLRLGRRSIVLLSELLASLAAVALLKHLKHRLLQLLGSMKSSFVRRKPAAQRGDTSASSEPLGSAWPVCCCTTKQHKCSTAAVVNRILSVSDPGWPQNSDGLMLCSHQSQHMLETEKHRRLTVPRINFSSSSMRRPRDAAGPLRADAGVHRPRRLRPPAGRRPAAGLPAGRPGGLAARRRGDAAAVLRRRGRGVRPQLPVDGAQGLAGG